MEFNRYVKLFVVPSTCRHISWHCTYEIKLS